MTHNWVLKRRPTHFPRRVCFPSVFLQFPHTFSYNLPQVAPDSSRLTGGHDDDVQLPSSECVRCLQIACKRPDYSMPKYFHRRAFFHHLAGWSPPSLNQIVEGEEKQKQKLLLAAIFTVYHLAMISGIQFRSQTITIVSICREFRTEWSHDWWSQETTYRIMIRVLTEVSHSLCWSVTASEQEFLFCIEILWPVLVVEWNYQ